VTSTTNETNAAPIEQRRIVDTNAAKGGVA